MTVTIINGVFIFFITIGQCQIADTASAAVTSHSGGAQQADGSCGQGQNHRTQRFRHQKNSG